MSRLNAFVSLVLLFILLSVVVIFGFYTFTPKVKNLRALKLSLQTQERELEVLEAEFDKSYARLQELQEREKEIDKGIYKHFDLELFEHYLQRYFKDVDIVKIESTQDDKYRYDIVSVQVVMASPSRYYHFIEALNHFEWCVSLESRQQFQGTKNGLQALFHLKVMTLK